MNDLLTGSPCGKSNGRFFSALIFLVCLLLFSPPSWEAKAVSVFIYASWFLGLGLWSTRALKPHFPDHPFFLIPLAAWILFSGFSACCSSHPAAGLNAVALDIAYALLFIASYLCSRDPGRTRTGLVWLSVAGLVLALYGCYQHGYGLMATYQHYFGGRPPAGPEETALAGRLLSGRAFALFSYPNLFAGFLAMLAPVVLALLFTARTRLGHCLWGLSLLGFMAGLVASGSVAGWAAACGGGVVFFLLMRRTLSDRLRERVWILGLSLAAAGLFLGGLILRVRGFHALLAEVPGRFSLWSAAFRMACDHGWLGVGPAGFGAFVPRTLAEGAYAQFAHNLWLQVLAETGFPGFLIFLALIISLILFLRKRWQAVGDNFPRVLAAGLAGSLAAGLLHASLDLDLQFLKTGILFWLLGGTLLGLTYAPEPDGPMVRQATVPESRPEIIPAGLCLLAVALLWRGGHSHPVEALLYAATAGLLFWFFHSRRNSNRPWPALAAKIPLLWPLAALFFWGLVSALGSENPAAAIPGLTLAATGLLLYSLACLTPRLGRDLLRTLTLSSAVLAGLALIEALVRHGLRVTAGWPNPNLLAAFFSMGLAANAAFLLEPGQPRFLKWKYGLSSFVIFLALLATGSLAGMVSAAGGLILLFAGQVRRNPRRILTWAAAGLVCMGLLVFFLPLPAGQRLREIRNYSGQALERLGMAQAAMRMAKDRPVSGIGPGNFEEVFARYQFPNVRGLSRYGKTTAFAHNEILQILAVLGVPGLFLLVWLLAAGGGAFRHFWWMKSWDPVRWGSWAALAAASVQALADFNWHLPALWVWGLLLLAVAQTPRPEPEPATEPAVTGLRPAGSWEAASFLLGLLALAACLAAWRPLLSAYYQKLGQAQSYKQNLAAAEENFTTALEFHPFASEAYDYLGQVHADLYATTGVESEFRLAEWAFQKAMALDRLDAFIHRHLGMLYAMKGGRLSDAERWRFLSLAEDQYRLALQQAPTNAMIDFELGNLLRDAGRMAQAESAWQEAVRLEPNYAAAWSNLGAALEMRDNDPEAERCWRRALALRRLVPQVEGKYEIELLSLDWSVVHYNLGHMLEHDGRWNDARQEYLAVLEMEPNNTRVRQRVKALEKLLP